MSEASLIQIDGFLTTRLRQSRHTPMLSVTPPFPSELMLELTTGCNHACVFCKNPTMTRPQKKMPFTVIESILQQAYTLGATKVGLSTTGDPFMFPHLADVVTLAKLCGYTYVYVSTNGALATPDKLKAVLDAGLDSLKFSINAGSRERYAEIHGHDEFALVLQHLAWAVKYKAKTGKPAHLGVTYVQTKTNADEVAAFRELLSPFVDEVYISPCGVQSGYQLENIGALAENPIPVDPPCPLLWNRVHVTAEGYLTLCCVDYQNYLAIEDLNRIPLAEAWHSVAFQEMRRKHLEHDLGTTLCGQCLSGKPQHIEPLRHEWATTI